jgi:hypothetical protein
VLLRPLPVLDQDRLVVAWKEPRTSGAAFPFGGTEIEAVADSSQLLVNTAGVSTHGTRRSLMLEHGVSSFVNDALVTGGFFDVLGVQPVLGRTITRTDDVDGAENVLVLSHGLWQRYVRRVARDPRPQSDARRAAVHDRWRDAPGRGLSQRR